MLRAEEIATSITQLATKEERADKEHVEDNLLNEATACRHWVAVGYSDQEELASVDRKIEDGILFSVTVSVAGRRCVALIDSGASQSYISPEMVTLCELQCSPILIHLELADGSKVRSTQQT